MTDWTKQPTHKLILEILRLRELERDVKEPLGSMVTDTGPALELDRRLPPSPSRKPPKKRSQNRRRARFRAVMCPTCGVGVNERCRDQRNDSIMKGVHPARRAP